MPGCNKHTKAIVKVMYRCDVFSSKDYGQALIQFFTPIIVKYMKKNLDITKSRYSEQISGTANDCFL